MRRWATLLGLLLALGGSLVGCAGSLPTTHYYTLRAPDQGVSRSDVGDVKEGLTIGVESFAVDPPYDQDRLVYRRGRDSSEVGFYAYHRWAAPLGRLLAVAFVDGFASTPGVASIEPRASAGSYSARLGGRLFYLEEVDLPGSREARIKLELELRDEAGATIWSEVFTSSASGEASSGAEVMEQVNQAFESVLVQAQESLEAALAAG